MPVKLSILAVGAQSDDSDVSCAGTLIRYVNEGHKVYDAITFTGNLGSNSLSGPEIDAWELTGRRFR
jgi:LmbE family N-acetylglucosaminyl deacetylase